MLFKNREEAGKKLAQQLLPYRHQQEALVLALPRGGVVLGFEIAKALEIPLDIVLVRKLGVPWQEELAFGAVAVNGIQILNRGIVASLNIEQETIERVSAKEKEELARRNFLYRQGKAFPSLEEKTVILVDDGIATGATMRAAISAVRSMGAKKVIVAVPLASQTIFEELADQGVELVVLKTPEPFFGVGMWYGEFPQVSDKEVIELLTKR